VDNTPRRGTADIIVANNTPEVFGLSCSGLQRPCDKALEEKFIFINAWNEWADGNYLEPDHRYGLRVPREVSSRGS